MPGFARSNFSVNSMTSVVAVAAMMVASPVQAQTRKFDIPSQPAEKSIPLFAKQAGIQLVANGVSVRGKRTNTVRGSMPVDRALRALLSGTGLTTRKGPAGSGIITVVAVQKQAAALAPPPAPATSASKTDISDGSEIVVTAQKRTEALQDVPISVSAFSAKSLDEQKIEGGSELVRAVPNVSFSKTNFASYNFSIRGIGTKALSVTSDPAVAISFNNTPLLRNRLFEQEYFDVERVEVLRGPQGTLYGRNATGGVVNMISAKPKLGDFDGWVKGEVGNYETTRLSGMLNVPLGDTLAVRAAGAWTKREGYDFNTLTNQNVNGRDLWSTRVSAAWEPSDRFRVNAIWEHFEEDDNRSRTGKQLCHNDPGPTSVGTVDISNLPLPRGALSQGCVPGSLYTDEAYGVPNGLSLPYVQAASTQVLLGRRVVNGQFVGGPIYLMGNDPYAGLTQSKNLREIATAYDPTFRAKNDVYQLNVEFDVSPTITFTSQTAYTKDFYHSTQDYNRFNSGPVFNDSAGLYLTRNIQNPTDGITPGGIFVDPQLGSSNRLIAVDMVKSHSDQWYQELRLQSSFDGPLNFNLGVNYLKFKIDEDYYVFSNAFTAIATGIFNDGAAGNPVNPCNTGDPLEPCIYIDPNPISEIDGDGHNYFRSRNLAQTRSKAIFGEVYWEPTDNLKVTAGLRYTDDKKTATPIKSQLLLTSGFAGSGYIGRGYRISPDIVQKWGRVTGRFVVDWSPDLGITDDSLFYASYSRGYKGGGANPPSIDGNPEMLQFFPQPETFRPESVNAFEIGTKNVFDGGKLTLNANAFYYDYKDYQVSQIVDRLALNENFDAEIWGAELEMIWRPSPRFRVNTNLGYLGTRIANGMTSIDVMNRTQGNDEWMVVKPWMQLASNCIAPKSVVEQILSSPFGSSTTSYLVPLCGGSWIGNYNPSSLFSILTGVTYDPAVDAPNQGRGFDADLGGNELPNSPHWTFNLGAQYTLPLDDWDLTLRGDYYRQAKSWARVYNTVADRLKAWDNANVSITLERPDSGFAMQFYVKNLFNKTPITDAFLNSDDSGLTTNVFTLDPRIIGFNVTKQF
ncbi:outer membrane cobalamin receptor protein [Sphingopyxis fribergensis]|uniref:Outer membrane cobalamin receptor protein n=1 Tax=Sphingopyxis fribergensis TaxID=1515612 RepID=A0A0A7PG56_9SPHN|nr:TonB-dependent receptor [Sphingopyxis fribergensis]AJA09086.1 outer membrane cobalamin receptor protein [Sphingopyxis fribergensis]